MNASSRPAHQWLHSEGTSANACSSTALRGHARVARGVVSRGGGSLNVRIRRGNTSWRRVNLSGPFMRPLSLTQGLFFAAALASACSAPEVGGTGDPGSVAGSTVYGRTLPGGDVPCGLLGQACCASLAPCGLGLTCRDERCQTPFNFICRQINNPCASVEECCSGTSCRGVAGWSPLTVRALCCREAGLACDNNRDCCGRMICAGGRCICAPIGGRCVESADCCSGGACMDGTCRSPSGCHGEGRACASSVECCAGHACDGGTCRVAVCHTEGACERDANCCANYACYRGACQACERGNGAPCTGHSQCCSNRCSRGLCAERASNGEPCDSHADCVSGRCSGGVCAERTLCGSCTSDADCVGGRCSDGSCRGQCQMRISPHFCGSTCECCSGRCEGGNCR